MPIIDQNISFPYFVSNQVLTAKDLNNMVEYLASQNRLSRVQIMGMGILAGLEIEPQEELIQEADENTGTPDIYKLLQINISAGYGVTSLGHLFQFEREELDYVAREVDVPRSKFFCGTTDSRGTTSNGDARVLKVCELKNSSEVRENSGFRQISTISVDADLDTEWRACFEKKVLIICQDEESTTRNSCFNDCDEKGEDRKFQYRFFLIDKAVINEIWKEVLASDDTTESPRVNLTECPYIERLGYVANLDGARIDICDLTSWREFYASYRTIVERAIPRIVAAYAEARIQFSSGISLSDDPSVLDDLEQNLFSLLGNNYPVEGDPPKDCSDIQYLYDYFKDLILAFWEFEAVSYDLEIPQGNLEDAESNNVNFCQFPTYLALGLLQLKSNQTKEDLTDLADEENSQFFRNCRTDNRGSGFQTVDQERLARARGLFSRMLTLANQRNILIRTSAEKEQDEIRITPSQGKNVPLEQRAIPFYYRQAQSNVRLHWNADAHKYNTWPRIPHYFSLNTKAPFDYHLLYDLDRYDFFRIEGHVGEGLASAKRDIQQLRKRYNLPFDIQCVHLNDLLSLDINEHDFDCKELDLIFLQVKYELLCHIEEQIKLRGSLGSLVELKGILAPLNTTESFEQVEEAFFAIFDKLYGPNKYIDCYSVSLKELSSRLKKKERLFGTTQV